MISITDLSFQYDPENQFDFEDLHFPQGKTIMIHGPSGSGKTTLLHLISGILQTQKGSIKINDQSITELSHLKKDQFRKNHMGYVFQQFNLLPYLSVHQNIYLPLELSKVKRAKTTKHFSSTQNAIDYYTSKLQINDPKFLKLKADQLSHGQKQRVAVARACIGFPSVILADEPTSSLDPVNTKICLDLLMNQCREYNSTLVMVTHDISLKSYFDEHFSFDEVVKQR